MTIRFGSLFTGIGGMDLGLERSGMVCEWQVELDGYATRVLEKHWPNVRRERDVREFPPKPAARWRVDAIVGGFPCQPVSCAGRRQAQRDPRWLWPHFARVVRVLRPDYVVVENVPGLLVRGYGFDEVLGDLAEMGLDAEWAVLPASAFGAPHIRERVFIVAYASVFGRQGQHGRQGDVKLAKRRQSRLGKTAADVAGPGARNVSTRSRTKRKGTSDASGPCAIADANCLAHEARIFRPGRAFESLPYPCWESDQPGVVRAAHGISNRVDRIKGLGNAVVPQVSQWLGERILEHALHQLRQ